MIVDIQVTVNVHSHMIDIFWYNLYLFNPLYYLHNDRYIYIFIIYVMEILAAVHIGMSTYIYYFREM